MTIAMSEQAERAELLERMRKVVDDGTAAAYAQSPIAQLRHAVLTCEAQTKRYEDCGFVDAGAAN